MERGARGSGIAVDPARVREARLEAGLSLAGLARNDVSRTFIHFIETGKSRPSPRVLAMIARRTGKPIGYFTGQTGRNAQRGFNLASELERSAIHVREFIESQSLDEVEASSLKLIEANLRQATQVLRAIQKRSSGGRSNR